MAHFGICTTAHILHFGHLTVLREASKKRPVDIEYIKDPIGIGRAEL